MAHFAEIDENNIVLRVIVVSNNELLDDAGVESETKGVKFCQYLLGGNWKQTSYNGNIRKNYAGIGYTYDAGRDAFIPQKPPYASWVLNEQTCLWESPTPMPTDGKMYFWDEAKKAWDVQLAN